MERKHLDIRVAGRVQGVGFRASAAQKARLLALTGFVRNERDGSVYIEAEGEPEVLDEFVAWCKLGPPAAVVKSCDVQETSMKHYPDFSIQH